MKQNFNNRAAEFEEVVRQAAHSKAPYVLRLYITGSTPRSCRAIRNLRAICDAHLNRRYDLEVIDIYQQPAVARDQQIIAAPTLVKQRPAPLRRLVGDLSDTARVLMGLDLHPATEH